MSDLRFKVCSRCGRLKPEGAGGSMCSECEAAWKAKRAEERARRDWPAEYRSRVEREDPRYRKFYKSRDWKMLSAWYSQKAGHRCEECGGVGTDVHHVVPIQEAGGWERRLDASNLRLLCVKCHNKEHGRTFGNKWGGE